MAFIWCEKMRAYGKGEGERKWFVVLVGVLLSLIMLITW